MCQAKDTVNSGDAAGIAKPTNARSRTRYRQAISAAPWDCLPLGT